MPTVDDVFAFERELCGDGAALGGTVLTFGALFGQIATAAGRPPGAILSPAQRRRCVEVAVEDLAGRLGPLRRSAARPGFAAAFTRLLDELQGAGVGPPEVEASAGTLEGSAYLADVATLFAGYEAARERSGRLDAAGIAREATGLLARRPRPLGRPPGLPLRARRPHPGAVRPGRGAGARRPRSRSRCPSSPATRRSPRAASCWDSCASGWGGRGEVLEADPGNTESAQLYALSRGFGLPEAPPTPLPDPSDLTLLRSAGTRARQKRSRRGLAADPRGRGAGRDRGRPARPEPPRPAVEAALEANGIAAALEAEVPVAMTSVGGAVVALLETAFGTGRAADLLRYLRGPSGFSPGRVDWLERAIRRDRIADAETALARWRGEGRDGAPAEASAAVEGSADARVGEDPRDSALRGRGIAGGALRRRRRAGGDDGLAAVPHRRGRPATRTGRRSRAARRGGDRGGARRPRRPRPARARAGASRGDGRARSTSASGAAGRGPGADRQSVPPARRPLRPCRSSAPCRTASSRAATAAATPSSRRRNANSSASTRVATPKRRSATSSASASPSPAGASSSPTATATRTAPPSPARPCWRMYGR